MFKLTGDEMATEINAVLHSIHQGKKDWVDFTVAKACAIAVIEAEMKKEKENAG